jgi:hypothetical protein
MDPARHHVRPAGLAAVIALGAVATMFGLVACIDHADYLMWLGDPAERGERVGSVSAEPVAYLVGKAMLIVVETVACVLFTVLGVAVARVRARDALLTLCVVIAIAKVVWLLASLGANWKPGWWYILDPKAEPWPRVLIGFSAAQALAWVFAAVAAGKRPAAS